MPQQTRLVRDALVAAALLLPVVVLSSSCTAMPAGRQPPSSPSSPAGQVTPPTNKTLPTPQTPGTPAADGTALAALAKLKVKGRAPKTGYSRSQFGDGWASAGGCNERDRTLRRDLDRVTIQAGGCRVLSGQLADPYTGQTITMKRSLGDPVQVDHVAALSDSWQKGAQSWTARRREAFANDPLNLLAVDGSANESKGDGDAATWLPPNKSYRCPYVARQISVKDKYGLWLTAAEKSAMTTVLTHCPTQKLITETQATTNRAVSAVNGAATKRTITAGARAGDCCDLVACCR